MVEPAVDLLIGRGHRVIRARDADLSDEDDQVLVEYALALGLIILTFDRGMRRKVHLAGGQCLWIETPEPTAKKRLADGYRDVCALLQVRHPIVSVKRNGMVK
jgi:hypothetical protein